MLSSTIRLIFFTPMLKYCDASLTVREYFPLASTSLFSITAAPFKEDLPIPFPSYARKHLIFTKNNAYLLVDAIELCGYFLVNKNTF